jgi:hypothetical protein
MDDRKHSWRFDPMPAGTPVQVRLQDDELGALDSYRRKKLNPQSRSKALRELAHIALVSAAMSPKPHAIEPVRERIK